MKKILRDKVQYVDYILFFAGWLFYVFFQRHYWMELPSMSYFEQIELAGLFLDGNMKFTDLFSAYSEHGMFGTNVLMLLNIAFFDLTTTFDIVVNTIIVAIFGGTCFLAIRKYFREEKRNLCYYLAITACGFFAFNVVQGCCSGMDLQVRLGMLFGLFATVSFDSIMRGDKSMKQYLLFSLLTFLYINVFGTLYCLSSTAVFLVVIAMRTITEKKWDRAYVFVLAMSILCWVLYFVQYPTVGNSTNAALGGEEKLDLLSTIIFYFRALLVYSGSFMLGYDTIVDSVIPLDLYMVVGFFVLQVVIWVAVRFFRTKMYQRTWLPLMLIGYSYAVFCMLILGRNDLGVEWFASSWYHVHTKAAVIGVIWIIMNDAMVYRKVYRGLCAVTCTIFIVLGMFGVSVTSERVPHVRTYLLNKVPFLYVVNAEDMPVDDNGMTPLDHNLDMTMKCLQILRKHKLSVFSDPANADRVYMSAASKVQNGEFICTNGIWDDGWTTKAADIVLRTGEGQTQVVLRGFCPFEITGSQVITVTIGEQITQYYVTSSQIEIVLNVPANAVTSIALSCNFSQVNLPDVRELCFMLTGIDGFTRTF